MARHAAEFLALAALIFFALRGAIALGVAARLARVFFALSPAWLAAALPPPPGPSSGPLELRDLLILSFITALAVFLPLSLGTPSFSGPAPLAAAAAASAGRSPPPTIPGPSSSPASSLSSPPASSSSGLSRKPAAAGLPPNPYLSRFEPLKAKFLEYTDIERNPAVPAASAPASSGPSSPAWIHVMTKTFGACEIEVHRRANAAFCFRLVATMEGTPEETFDLLSDVDARKRWDDLCEGAGIAEIVGPGSKVIWMHTKGFWPTAPRDALVVGFVERLKDGRYLNVTQSVESSKNYTPRSGSVRMKAYLAGQIVSPDPKGRPNFSRVVQVMEGDLGGSLPQSLVSMVTTQTMHANSILKRTTPQRTVSRLIEEAEGREDAAGPSDPASLPSSSSSSSSSVPHDSSAPSAGGAADPKPTGRVVVGGVDLTATVNAANGLRQALEAVQPFLVATLFVVVMSRRRGR
ncbi:hypothetical protein DFJ73DRAFT_961077 [Zopfochytrium polystomum]|nr:hypothetical protein DFJ73DRAFT_961077 [Zopfochytrium polystomum]